MEGLFSIFDFDTPSSTQHYALRQESDSGDMESRQRRTSSRSRVIIPVKLKPGGLSRFGYHADNSTLSRHIALLRAAREEGFPPIIRRLSLIATFSKYRTPHYSRIFKKDQQWLSRYYKAVKTRRSSTSGRGTRSGLTSGAAPPSAPRGSSMSRDVGSDDYDEEDYEDEESSDAEDDDDTEDFWEDESDDDDESD